MVGEMIFKKISKFFIVFMLCIIAFLFSSVDNSFANADFYELEKIHYNSFSEVFDTSYNVFLDSIGKCDLQDVNAFWIRLRDYNDKLIIGGSGVVWCGDTMRDSLDYYGYDIVGFGGMTDNKIKEWVPRIKKKYKKIILFEGVNTINLAVGGGMKKVSQELIESVVTTIVMIQNELLEPSGEFVYVKVKPMTYPQDVASKNTMNSFNKMSEELNIALTSMNIPLYELKYPTTKEYSTGYVHYNNKVVWDDMLK